ncbi:MAG: hypothetical protein AB1696_13715 [Planctomycetota bacterium]
MPRIHRRLVFEELEPRIAPVTLSSANPVRYFNDSDGDEVMIRYIGAGTAHVLFGGGEDPNLADEIATIDLAGTGIGTQLIIRDVLRGAGNDTISGGAITGQAGEDMGMIQLSALGGAVNSTTISIDGSLRSLTVSGNANDVNLNTAGDVSSVSIMGDFGGGGGVSVLGRLSLMMVSGAVNNAIITANTLSSFRAGSLADADITGTIGLTMALVTGSMADSHIVSGGDATMLYVKGDVTNTTSLLAPFRVTGNLGRLMVGGSVNNTPGGDTPFLSVTGNLGGLQIRGNLTNTNTTGLANHVEVGGSLGPAMVLGSVSDTRIVPAEAMSFIVRGDFNNSDYILGAPTSTRLRSFTCFGDVTNGSNINITGDFGMFMGRGGLTDSQVAISGAVRSFQMFGAVDNTALTFGGAASMLRFSGNVSDTTLTVTGAVTQAAVMGAVTNSTLNLNGGGSFVRLYGATTDADVAVVGALRTLYLGAPLGVGSDVVIGGNLTMAQLIGGMGGGSLTVNGDALRVLSTRAMDNGSSLTVTGTSDYVQVTGGILNGSDLTLGGDAEMIQIQAARLGPCIDGTSSLTLASILTQFLLGGQMLGTVNITGSLAGGAAMRFSQGLAGTLAFAGDVDGPFSLLGDINPGGAMQVGGDVTPGGKITVSGAVKTPGETSIDIAGSVYGDIIISSNHQGLLNVDGDVSSTLQAANFDQVDIGTHATETGDLLPGGKVIAAGSPGTINSIVVHGRCYGTVSDATNLQEHNPLPDVFILDPGETESYADADGDYVIIAYNGDVGSNVTVTMAGAGRWRDIASLVYAAADTDSSLDISVGMALGGGWTTVGTVDAAGQTIGDLHIHGSIGALTTDTIAAGDTVTTWSANSNGGMGTVTIANDIAGALEIGGSLTNQIVLGGGIVSTGRLLVRGVQSGAGHRGNNAPLILGGAIDPAAEIAVVKPGTYTGTGRVYLENVVDTPALTTVNLYNLTYTNRLTGSYARIALNAKTGTTVTRANNNYTDIDNTKWELAEVSAYYYVDRFHSYLALMGYGDKWNRPISMTVNVNEDNAYYHPSTGALEFGMPEGADVSHSFATDGDTVLHEYNHAWTDELISVGSLGYGNDVGDLSGAIDEALSDYRAASFFNDSLLFEPDAPAYWRDVNNTDEYPHDIYVSDEHWTGLILSGAFWDLRTTVGMAVADTLSLAMLPYLEQIGTTGPNGLEAVFNDVYQAVVQADNAIYGGVHVADITTAFNAHGINVAPDAILNPGDSTTFTDSDGDLVTVQYTGTAGSVEVYLDGPAGAHTAVSIVYINPNANSAIDISADDGGGGNNRTPPANLFSAYGEVFGSATVEGPIYSIGSGVIASGETVSNTSAGVDGDLLELYNGGVLGGALSIGGDLTGMATLDGNLSGTVQVNGNLSGTIEIGSVGASEVTSITSSGVLRIGGGITSDGLIRIYGHVEGLLDVDGNMNGEISLGSGDFWLWADIGATGRVNIDGDIGGTIYVYGYIDGRIDCGGSVIGTANTDFLYIEASVWYTGVVDIAGDINNRDITIDLDLLGALYAGRFEDVYVERYFEGRIAADNVGSGNTLDVGATRGGLVTPINAFTYYYGYP